MSDVPLLPRNSTPLEVATTKTLSDIQRVAVPLRAIWDPQSCPENMLPYLAWAFSVDRWDPGWGEQTQRDVIAQSFYVHKHKGTISSLRRVVEPLGFLLTVTEWWETDPAGEPGTFSFNIGLGDTAIPEQVFYEIERLVDNAKPVSRHVVGLKLSRSVSGVARIGSAVTSGVATAIYPLP